MSLHIARLYRPGNAPVPHCHKHSCYDIGGFLGGTTNVNININQGSGWVNFRNSVLQGAGFSLATNIINRLFGNVGCCGGGGFSFPSFNWGMCCNNFSFPSFNWGAWGGGMNFTPTPMGSTLEGINWSTFMSNYDKNKNSSI